MGHADARLAPHDPLATPDGMIWWSGQFANKLGRLDPKTGEMKGISDTPRRGPHGLINDKDGNIWYAGNWGGHIGRLDPKTGEVKLYKLPDPKAKDPHTPLFDKNGILWFSVQNGGFMGRLDPKTGEIKLLTPVGAAGQQPYALRFLSDGRQPWFSYLGNQQDRHRRSEDDGGDGVRPAGSEDPHPAHGRDLRRHDLVRRLVERQARALRPEDRRGQEIEGPGQLMALPALWDDGHQRRHLVRGVGPATEHDRAFRPEDGKIPDLDHSGRRRRASRDADARQQLAMAMSGVSSAVGLATIK